MKAKEEFVIQISDYDNRWNKIAAEIAREHLLQPAGPFKPREKLKPTEKQSPPPSTTNGQG